MKGKTLLALTALVIGSAFVLAAMSQVPAELEDKLMQVRSNLDEVKGELPEMECCISPQCNFCPLSAGKCPCGMNVKTEVGVCGECYDGWRAGYGHVPGVSPDEVPRLNQQMLEQMYEMRTQYFGEEAHSH